MLLVDVGNSRIKWAIKKTTGLTSGQSFPINLGNMAKSMTAAWEGLKNPGRVIVSNVAGAKIANGLQDWFIKHWHIEPEFAESQIEGFGILNAYVDGIKLGVDRWAGLVAMRHYYDLPACMVDCGTAITLDLVDQKGVHQGGMIMPGVSLMRKSLLDETHAIGGFGKETEYFLADNTADAVGNGTFYAAVGFAELALRRLKEEYKSLPTVVFTGGYGQLVAARVSIPSVYDPVLILKGLSIIAG